MLSFLPPRYQLYLNKVDFNLLYEIRLRIGFKVKIKVGDNVFSLGDGQVICLKSDIDEIVKNITERSLYAFNESLKRGFLTTRKGVRIGLAGECVYDNGKIITIKNITSLNIRIPHLIPGSANRIYKAIIDNKIHSALIISPPFYGKTTMLKDLIGYIDKLNKYNILVVDERNEFCLTVGENTDIIKYCNKDYAFSYGIRSMSPDVIITDELMGRDDWKSVENAIYSGVKVIASAHGSNIYQIKAKPSYIPALFDRYVVLNSEVGQAGIIDGVYDGEYNKL